MSVPAEAQGNRQSTPPQGSGRAEVTSGDNVAMSSDPVTAYKLGVPVDPTADSGSPPSYAAAISESNEEASHANATKSHQHQPQAMAGQSEMAHLVLPKFKKNQRKMDHSAHVTCCDPPPAGRTVPPAAAASPDAGAGILCRNNVGYHGFAAINVGTRDHMEDRHRVQYGKADGLFRAFFGVFGTAPCDTRISAFLSCCARHAMGTAAHHPVC